jgi:starvation-inducible outer membrane lipoprotein
MRLLTVFLALAASSAAAQTPPANAAREPLEPRRNQKIERIVIQDESNRIEELRVGGQTERVQVQPKEAPAYEVLTPHMSRSRPADHRDGMSSAGGKRVWNVLSF